MVSFSDTRSMTGTVLKQHPSIVIYPLFAALISVVFQLSGTLLPIDTNPFFAIIALLMTVVGSLISLTAFTYPIFRIGYAVAKQYDRPTHVSWNCWAAAFGLAIPWALATVTYTAIGLLITACFVFPVFMYFAFLWPIFPIAFGPEFGTTKSFSVAIQVIKDSPIWVACLGLSISLIVTGIATVQFMAVPALNVFLLTQKQAGAVIATNMVILVAMKAILTLAFLYPNIVVLMLVEDLPESELAKIPAWVDHYDENAATVAVAAVQVSPDVAAKIQQLADLRARGLLTEADFIRERAALRQ